MSERGRTSERPRGGDGFTLVELLVAIGVVGLIAVGITQVFTLTSDTVRQGRRLSNLLQSAGLVERQLREDLGRLSRDGFLVIRHAYVDPDRNGRIDVPAPGAPGRDAVAATPADTAPRLRRADELMFFAKGEFTSAREPLHPSRVPTAGEARIYYGHGLRQIAANTPDTYYRPTLTDTNPPASAPGLGERITNGTNPNRYAADWSLLRHVTLLSRPGLDPAPSLNPAPTTGVLANAPATDLRDSSRQIALQPAAMSIFRSLARHSAQTPNGAGLLRTEGGSGASGVLGPLFSSGLVDIAATDLAEIRATVLFGPETYLGGTGVNGPIGYASNPGYDQLLSGDRETAAGKPDRARMQRWMIDALPADSDGRDSGAAYAAPRRGEATRMRYEATPPDRFNRLERTDPSPEQLRADQQMLTASVLAPRCTEFIVEWSFGDVERTLTAAQSPVAGRLIWHGLRRLVDLNGDGVWDRDADYGVLPYPYVYANNDGDPTGPNTGWPAGTQERYFQQTYRRSDGTSAGWSVWPALIHPEPLQSARRGDPSVQGGGRDPDADGPVMYSLFGYVDPTFTPELPLANPGSASVQSPVFPQRRYASGFAYNDDVLRFDAHPAPAGSGGAVTYDPEEGDVLRDPLTIPWAWPVLLRVTVTLADPVDASVQQTFQVVLPVPAAAGEGDAAL